MSFIQNQNQIQVNEYLPNFLFVSNEEVERILEEENRKDAELIHRESELLLETASEINKLLEESGEILIKTDEVIEDAKESVDVAYTNIFEQI